MSRRCALLLAWLWFMPTPALALVMQISGLDDFTIPTWSLGDPAIQAHTDACVYGLNIPNLTSYAITATSSPAGFMLKQVSGTRTIPYTLYWDDGGAGNLGNSSGTQLSDGVKVSNLQHINVLNVGCVGGNNARLNLKITQADMVSALSGTYQGTITLLVSPN